MILHVDDVSCVIAERPVLRHVSFTQKKYGKLAIAGETGSGKITLLKIISGFVQPQTGKVVFDGQVVPGPLEKLVPGHPSIAYLSQYFELQKFLRVEQILDYASHLESREASRIFDLCQVTEFLKRRTDELSGGEKQRIGLARLLVGKPKLLLLDEPFSNLDPIHKLTLKNVLDDVSKHFEITSILVSHDPLDTLPWADEVLVLRRGEVIQHATPVDVYSKPIDEYTAGLFGDYTLLTPALATKFGLRLGTGVIRPEAFYISSNGVDGMVKDVNYFGAFAHVIIDLSGVPLIMHARASEFRPGDAVKVDVHIKKIHPLEKKNGN